MATLHGGAVNFGFTGTDGIAEANLTGKIFLQSTNLDEEGSDLEIPGPDGETAARVDYDTRQRATLEFIPKGADAAAARTNTTLANFAKGTMINITACASMPQLVQSNWIVTRGHIEHSNTGAAKIRLELIRYPGVTS